MLYVDYVNGQYAQLEDLFAKIKSTVNELLVYLTLILIIWILLYQRLAIIALDIPNQGNKKVN
ncbi:MAG: hypothetical protein ACTS73_09155 [Arsenophonus sp. NEOnobi-MAG3]